MSKNGLELLAPAGNLQTLKKVVDAGCDAVYFGGSMFGARAYADNFCFNDAIEGIKYAHLFNAKAFLTVNTLIKNIEYSKLYLYIKEYRDAGIDAVLVQDLIKRYEVEPQNILGHSDIAPQRKQDPGPLFPWEELYRDYGIGMWYDETDKEKYKDAFDNRITPEEVQKELRKFGYGIAVSKVYDEQTKNVITAFQFHFRQNKYDGIMDAETFAVLKALNEKYKK